MWIPFPQGWRKLKYIYTPKLLFSKGGLFCLAGNESHLGTVAGRAILRQQLGAHRSYLITRWNSFILQGLASGQLVL